MNASRIILLGTVVLLVAGCSSVRESIIPGKRAPDEFAVYTRAPLNLPPEYSLRVPAPGTERPQSVLPRDVVEEALLGSSSRVVDPNAPTTQSLSPGLQALLNNTGASSTDPNIRSLINQETSIFAEEDASVIERIIFWNTDTEYGVAVDPTEESKRIQENQALGQPLDNGEVPVIEKKQKGLLEGIFD